MFKVKIDKIAEFEKAKKRKSEGMRGLLYQYDEAVKMAVFSGERFARRLQEVLEKVLPGISCNVDPGDIRTLWVIGSFEDSGDISLGNLIEDVLNNVFGEVNPLAIIVQSNVKVDREKADKIKEVLEAIFA